MAMRELVEGECGGANPLMKFVSHFSQDKALSQEGLWHHRHQGPSNVQEHQGTIHEASDQQIVDEYFNDLQHHYGAPQTFQMGNLLQEIKQVENAQMMQPPLPDAETEAWAGEYLASAHGPDAWVEEYSEEVQHGAGFVEPNPELAPTKWASEYLEDLRPADSIEHQTKQDPDSKELSEAAGSLLECAEDPRFADSKFFKFIKKLNSGEYKIEDNKVIDAKTGEEVKTGEESERWVDEYEATVYEDADEWLQEYTRKQDPNSQNAGEQTVQSDGDFWGQLEEEWYNLARENMDEHPWLSEYTSTDKEYTFEDDNPMMNVQNPFEEGLKKLKEGDIISAILLFEAEVRQHPEHAEAWQYLGTSQSENEQDNLAISALNKCLNLQPDNLTALMTLAVCYTNESLQSQACNALKRWLSRNPRYSDLLNGATAVQETGSPTLRSSLMSSSMYNEVCDLYIRAAQLSPHSNIDAEVQIGLGVLFNLSGEYDKAVDCFHAALQTNTQDALIWNKLGATLANGGRSEEAVEAYRHALQLSPGYVRARYNLGISCVNLKVYREAVEHFLTALNIQKKGLGNGRESTSTMSESIWSTLRMSLSLMGRPELHEAVDNRDLEYLNEQFNIYVLEQPA